MQAMDVLKNLLFQEALHQNLGFAGVLCAAAQDRRARGIARGEHSLGRAWHLNPVPRQLLPRNHAHDIGVGLGQQGDLGLATLSDARARIAQDEIPFGLRLALRGEQDNQHRVRIVDARCDRCARD